MSDEQSVPVWYRDHDGFYTDDDLIVADAPKLYEPGVWRPLADDQRRDRIVRAAEAWELIPVDANGHVEALDEIRAAVRAAAVAAGRETA